jgi:hypothetical protein
MAASEVMATSQTSADAGATTRQYMPVCTDLMNSGDAGRIRRPGPAACSKRNCSPRLAPAPPTYAGELKLSTLADWHSCVLRL